MSVHPRADGLHRALLGLLLASVFLAVPARAYAFGYEPRTAVINTAIAQLGKRYEWAAAGPNTFDCSGLTQYSYRSAGISIPHQSGAIWSMCDTVTVDKLEPGDLVFRARLASGSVEPSSAANIYHVGIYVGGGRVIEASSKSKPIGYSAVGGFKHFGRLREKYWPDGDRSYDPPLLARGDYNGDRREDVAYVYRTGAASIRINVCASNGKTLTPAKAWYVSNGAWDWNRTKVVGGDFNGDGRSDLALVYGYSDGTVKAWVFRSDGKSFASKSVWWTRAPSSVGWSKMKLVAGDFNGDRKMDIAALCDDRYGKSHIVVLRSTGSAFGAATWWSSGSRRWYPKYSKIAAGDLTGDRRADIAWLYDVSLGRGKGAVYALTSTGSSFVNKGAWYAPKSGWDWNRIKMTTADLDGNGRADVMSLYDLGSGTSKLVVHMSTGSGLAAPKNWWVSGRWAWDWERSRLGAGDTDRDGRTEILMLYDNYASASRAWAVDAAAGGKLGPVIMGWYSGTGGLDWNRVR